VSPLRVRAAPCGLARGMSPARAPYHRGASNTLVVADAGKARPSTSVLWDRSETWRVSTRQPQDGCRPATVRSQATAACPQGCAAAAVRPSRSQPGTVDRTGVLVAPRSQVTATSVAAASCRACSDSDEVRHSSAARHESRRWSMR